MFVNSNHIKPYLSLNYLKHYKEAYYGNQSNKMYNEDVNSFKWASFLIISSSISELFCSSIMCQSWVS